MRRAVLAILLLILPVGVSAEIYWEENYALPCGLCQWTDYGLGHNHSVMAEQFNGSNIVRRPHPNGGFLDRATGKTHKQFNIRFWMKFDPAFQLDATGTKVFYLRAETTPIPQSPNGVLVMMFRNPDLSFALQGAYDSTDTETHKTGCTMTTTWKEFEFQWIMNDPGQKNGSETVWCNGVQTMHRTGREYKGPNQSGTFIDTVRDYIQFGQGPIYLAKLAVGNQRIGSGSVTPPPVPPPIPPPPTVTVTSVVSDVDGANVTIKGAAKKLLYWDDTTPKEELTDYVAGSLTYRLVKRWPPETTFTCVQPQDMTGAWTEQYQCTGVTPAPVAKNAFTNIINSGDVLKFDYLKTDCPNGIQRTTTGTKTKTVTITCLK